MADYITLDKLAENLNDSLNTISATLYTASSISREIPFSIVADVKDYRDDKQYSSTAVVPGIMTRLTGGVSPSQNYQAYNDTVLVTIYGFKREIADVMLILDTYMQENTGKFTRDSGWIYQQAFQRPSAIERGIDEGEERTTILLEIGYAFIAGGYSSDDVTVTINGTEIPIRTYAHSMQKESTVNDDLGEIGVVKYKPKKSTVTKVIEYWHIDDTELNSVLQDIDTGDYLTRSYTVVFSMGATPDYTNTETMCIIDGSIDFVEGGFVSVKITLAKYNELS